jgi:hypothetical protein
MGKETSAHTIVTLQQCAGQPSLTKSSGCYKASDTGPNDRDIHLTVNRWGGSFGHNSEVYESHNFGLSNKHDR